MEKSLTVTCTGKSSVNVVNLNPPILLSPDYSYSCALLDFNVYFSVFNVRSSNNRLWYDVGGDMFSYISIEPGAYEMDAIIKLLKNQMKKVDPNIKFNLEYSKNTLKASITCSHALDFTRKNSIHRLMGFDDSLVMANATLKATRVVDINKINAIRIDCNIVTNSFLNDKSTHTLHQFFPDVEAGYKINERPRNLIYMPITTKEIGTIQIAVCDQNGKLIDFNGEEITCRLHIKRDD